MLQPLRLVCAGVLIIMLFVLAACGEDEERRADDRGGTLTLLSPADVDFLDPGHTAFALGVQVAAATQRPLFTYRPDDLSKVVPDLAAKPPEITDGGRTVTVRIRDGVRFSPPVNRAVTSRDVAYALERFFSVNVGGLYTSYFSDLVGAPSAPTQGVQKISGITTPDDRTIVFRLKHPTSTTLVGALTMPASAAVPEEYARPFDAKNPSTYNTHVVATGPYMVRNDKAGNAVGYSAGRSIELVRNPSWKRSTDARPAYLDAVKIRTNASDAHLASRQVLAGSHMAYSVLPPPSILKDVTTGEQKDQAVRVTTGGYRFLPINTTIKPFDRQDVRRAVLAAFDRDGFRQTRGGVATGLLATHFLGPGIPGFEEAGGLKGKPHDFLANPDGDLAVATRYMKAAGFPSGRYTGDETFLVVSGNAANERSVAQLVKAQFERLGFKIRLRYVPDDALFTNWCSVPSKKVLACSTIGWLKDFADPEPMLRPVFDGAVIAPDGGNTNFSELDDPAINAAMAHAATLTGTARLAAWADIDQMIVSTAAAIPLQWDVLTLIRSKDVDGVASETFGSFDLSYTSLK